MNGQKLLLYCQQTENWSLYLVNRQKTSPLCEQAKKTVSTVRKGRKLITPLGTDRNETDENFVTLSWHPSKTNKQKQTGGLPPKKLISLLWTDKTTDQPTMIRQKTDKPIMNIQKLINLLWTDRKLINLLWTETWSTYCEQTENWSTYCEHTEKQLVAVWHFLQQSWTLNSFKNLWTNTWNIFYLAQM